MHKQTTLESILFIDIETVAACPNYQVLSERMKFFWDKKAEHLRKSERRHSLKIFILVPASMLSW
jgi:hypothetical protein